MKRKFFFTLTIFTLLLGLLLGACAPASTPATEEPTEVATEIVEEAQPTETPEPTLEPAEAETLEIEDALGRTVSIELPVERIISLAPSNTEILFAVDAGDLVVGRDSFSDYPEAALDATDIGGGFGELDTETILTLEADLVLAAELSSPEQIQTLEDLGLTVLVLPNPTNLEDMYANLQLVAQITDTQDTTKALIEKFKTRVAAVEEKVAATEERPLVFYELDATEPDAPWTPGPGSFHETLIQMAGGENMGSALDSVWAQISSEEVIAQDPDIILLGDALYGGVTPESVAARAGWEGLSAVQNDQVFTINDNLISRPGPRLVDGLEALAEIIHPAAEVVEIEDELGRTVTLNIPVQRIVSLAPSNTEILFAVGAGDNVVGVTEYCDYPEVAQEIEKIGGFSADTISVESIVALEPDLVVAYTSRHQPVIEALDKVNVPVLALAPDTIEDVYDNILLIGHLTGNDEQAAQTVADMQTRIEAVEEIVAEIPAEERLRVFYEIFDEPLMTAGPSTFTGQMIDLAGGVNIFAELEEDYPQINAEEVISRDPQVILGSDSHGDKLTPEQVAARPGWDQIEAVQNERIHLINGNIVSRPGPRLADAIEAMAQALYPDLFE
ncbi:MAG: helical backbone metal receptor [Chloroflexota bacterium]|nr:helical backbone metal receptor [Chloroflexota bacterium]